MAEDLSIKVKVEPDVSDLSNKLKTAGNGVTPIPVKISLANIGDIKNKIAALGTTIDVNINPVIAGGSISSAVQSSMKGQKIDLDMFDTSKVAQELKNVSDAMTQVANKVTATFKTKVDTTMKATAGNIAGLSKTFGAIEKRIKGVNDAASKSQLESQYKTLKSQWDGLITSGVMSTGQFSGMSKELSMLQREVIAVEQAEKEIAGLPNSISAAVGSLNALETSFKNTLGLKYGALDLTESKAVLQDIDALRTGLSNLNGDKKSLELFLDNWRSKAAAVGVDMKGLGDIMKFVSAEIATATKSGNEWNKMAQEEANVAKAQADAVDKLITKAKQVTDARSKLDLTGLTGNKDVDNALTAYNSQRFITRNSRSLAENHPDNAQYVKDYQDNVEKLENLFYDLANAAKVAGKQVESVLDLSDARQKLGDALNKYTSNGEYTAYIENLRNDAVSLLSDINKAEQAFNGDWNIDTFKELINLMSQGAPLAEKLGKAIRSANEKNSNNLQKQFEQLKSAQSTMTSDFGTLQQNVNNQNWSVPNGLRNTQKEVDGLKVVLDEVNTTLATGDFSKLPDLFARITSSGYEVKSVSDVIDYVTSSIKNANAAIKQYGASLENMNDNDKMFDKKLFGGSTTNGEYSDFKNSYTSKAKLDDIYAKAEAQKNEVYKAKRRLTTDSSIENIKNYNKEVEKLTALVAQLRKEMQTVKFGDTDFLSGQFADKEKTIATLKGLLDKFNANVGAAGVVSSSKAFAGDLQYVIDELDKLGSVSDLGSLFKSTGTEFDNIRGKAYSTGESFETLASIVSYFRKAMAEANNEAKKYNDAQSKIGKEHESFNDTKTEEKYTNRNNLFAEYANYAKSHTPTKQLQDMEGEYVSLVNKVNNARKVLKADWSTENLETYLNLLDQMYNKGETIRKQLKSVEYSEDESLRKQYSNVNSKITEIDRAMNTYKNALGNARDKGFDDSAFMRLMDGDSSTGYVGIREALKNVIDSGDYTQLTGVFQQFANELSESGTAAKNLAEFMALVSRRINQVKQSAKEFNDTQQAKLNENSWGKSMQNTMYTAERYFNNNSAISKNVEAYAKFTDFFNTWKPKIESKEFSKDNANEMSKAWSSLKKEIQDAGLETDTLAVKLKKLFEVNIKSQLANQVINAFQQGLRQVYQNVVDIDSAMTELKKVTDETSGAYSKFLSEAGDRAKNLGVSISDVVNATADFARLGYNLEDATQISDSAVMFKQVGDGVQSMDDATSDIISAMKAFNIEADKSLTITDRYNEVGNSFSITSAGVAEALKRSASSLHTAGNDIDQSIGMIVAANDVVQDPDSVGAGLRVIALRIRGATSELESMGEETDTVVKSTAKLQAEIKAISGVNILENDNATFKSTYQIMDELSAKWSQLSDIQKATLTDKIAGKNRANIFSSMMENWEDAKKAMETSKNSAGSATKELDTYLSSIEGKLSRFQATFQSFSSDILDSGVVKGFIDMGTAALDFADGLVKAGDAMPTILTALSAVASLTNTKAGVNMPTYATGIAA